MSKEHRLHIALEQLDEVIGIYVSSLDLYTMEQLRYKPTADKWSLGEMYDHIINAALNIYFPAIIKCKNEPKEDATSKTQAGEEIFKLGAYPDKKVKNTMGSPKAPNDKQQLYDGLGKIKVKAHDMLPTVITAQPEAKVMHPRLGALNAEEWFLLVGMHLRHHLRQKEELERTYISL
ncbi:DinB family protein [Alicyclobacillus tolerans]|uniref:DinB family protein n=1 Tax=Alicyclobacillus tolerans TaxID=90970 RepID=UPI001F36CCF6|nr:DinB family protein [Alicyclobacillus tolerans]MCF8567329.1 DinB family protein [Alicyclobacillus tolerans]